MFKSVFSRNVEWTMMKMLQHGNLLRLHTDICPSAGELNANFFASRHMNISLEFKYFNLFANAASSRRVICVLSSWAVRPGVYSSNKLQTNNSHGIKSEEVQGRGEGSRSFTSHSQTCSAHMMTTEPAPSNDQDSRCGLKTTGAFRLFLLSWDSF